MKAKVNDFQKIEGWTVGHDNAAHESDLSWLRHQIGSVQAENKKRQKGEPERLILVVKHHAPLVCGTSSPDQAKNPWSPAFATEILSQGVDLWPHALYRVQKRWCESGKQSTGLCFTWIT